ncbi:MAG: pyrroline-5-carboxylate reductase [Christensenellales bacterium]
MTTYAVGFIGAGNMAYAIIKGCAEKGIIDTKNIFVFDIDGNKTEDIREKFGVLPVCSVSKLCGKSDIIILAIKPNVIESVLADIKDFTGGKTIVSIAAGWSAEKIRKIIGTDKRVCRIMPNTPLTVGEGMSVFETPCEIEDDKKRLIESIFSSLGQIDSAPAAAMDAVTAVSGSGPAYVFMMIEALADAGVLCGLTRAQATKLAAQTVLGSAKMVLLTGSHPGALKDAVCSPGGTTIEAVKSLERDGFRGALIKAVEKCAAKSKSMSDK